MTPTFFLVLCVIEKLWKNKKLLKWIFWGEKWLWLEKIRSWAVTSLWDTATAWELNMKINMNLDPYQQRSAFGRHSQIPNFSNSIPIPNLKFFKLNAKYKIFQTQSQIPNFTLCDLIIRLLFFRALFFDATQRNNRALNGHCITRLVTNMVRSGFNKQAWGFPNFWEIPSNVAW